MQKVAYALQTDYIT